MHFVLVGNDPRTWPLARAIIADRQHTLLRVVDGEESFRELVRYQTRLQNLTSIDEVLQAGEVQAVILGRGVSNVSQLARAIAAAGKSLLMPPDLDLDGILPYELWLEVASVPGSMFAIQPLRQHPLLQSLRTTLAEFNLQDIHHVHLKRRIAVAASTNGNAAGELNNNGGPSGDPSASTQPLLCTTDLDRAFLFDVDTLRFLVGEFDTVSCIDSSIAIPPAKDDTGLPPRNVILSQTNLTGSQLPATLYVVEPGDTESWSLEVTTVHGSYLLTGDPAAGALTLKSPGGGANSVVSQTDDGGTRLLDAFVSSRSNPATASQSWWNVTRDFDLLDGRHRSLKRRRTVDVYLETVSERSHFKSQMTALGCGLIMMTPVLMVLFLVLSATVDLHPMLRRAVPVIVFSPLFLFLLLQMLILYTRDSGTRTSSGGERTEAVGSPR